MKQTEIGLIPDDWEVERLGDVGEPCMCKRILKEQTSPTGDIPFYKIGTFGGIPDAYISRELFEHYKEQYSYPKKGTLLLSAAGTIGRVVVFDGKDSYFQDSNIVWIENDETQVTNDFLFYCYSRMQWKTEEGGIVSRLYNANLKSTSFISPKSIEEQQRIAKALSDVDALISTTEKLLQKKRNIKQGTMQELLTGKKRLPGFAKSNNTKMTELGEIPEDWEVKKLKTECTLITKGTTPSSLGFSFVSSGINFLKIEAIDKFGNLVKENLAYIDELTNRALYRSQLQKNDLLISIAGALGRMFIVKDTVLPANINQALAIIRLKKDSLFDYEYVFYFLSSTQSQNIIKDLTVTGAQPNISLDNVRNFWIASPSSKAEQTAIANVLSSMDKEIETLNTKLEKYRNLKTAMMQQLLTGKIRLV